MMHFWRVRAYKNDGAGLWSDVRQFTTISLSPPTLVFPANNSYDLYTTVGLVWNSVPQALAYNIRVASDPNFANVVASAENLDALTYTVSNLFTVRKYYWQVQTVGAQGTSNWSAPFNFTTLDEPVLNGSTDVCENRISTYSSTVSPLVDYQWTVTGGTIVGSSTGATVNVMWGAAGNGTVKVQRSSDAWGNYTDGKTINVVKESISNVAVTINANTYFDDEACMNEYVTISAAIASNGIFTYEWKVGNTVVSTNPEFVYHCTTKGTFAISVTVTGVDCEAGTASTNLVVVDDCPVTILNESVIYTCMNQSPQLMNVVFGGSGSFSYSWTPANDLVAANVLNPVVKNATQSRVFNLTVTDIVNNTFTYSSTSMVVRNSPNISFSPSTKVVKNNLAVDLMDPSFVAINISGGQAPYSNYLWEDTNYDPVDDPHNVFPALGTNRYYLTVDDSYGCRSVQRRFTILRSNSKDVGEIVTGLTGEIGRAFV